MVLNWVEVFTLLKSKIEQNGRLFFMYSGLVWCKRGLEEKKHPIMELGGTHTIRRYLNGWQKT